MSRGYHRWCYLAIHGEPRWKSILIPISGPVLFIIILLAIKFINWMVK